MRLRLLESLLIAANQRGARVLFALKRNINPLILFFEAAFPTDVREPVICHAVYIAIPKSWIPQIGHFIWLPFKMSHGRTGPLALVSG